MEIKIGIKLSRQEVFDLLTYFDDSSDHPLHEGLDLDSYSEKLSRFAYFVFAIENDQYAGFAAYYLNDESQFVYIPQIVVHKNGRHKGVGHMMLNALSAQYAPSYRSIDLEVLVENLNARAFYEREGFVVCGERGIRQMLRKEL